MTVYQSDEAAAPAALPRSTKHHVRQIVRMPALVLAAALVAVMFDVFAMGSTVLPHVIAGVTPSGPYAYRGFRPGQPYALSVDPAGAYEAEWAWMAYFTRSMQSGVLPLWNPHQGLGQPQLANYVPSVLFPVNWLTLVLPRPWWDLIYFVDWFLAAYWVYLFCRVIGLGRGGSLAGGVSVFAAGFIPAYLEVKSIAGSVASFPWLMYSIERTVRQPGWRWKTLSLAAATYFLATGGHPSPALFGLVFAVTYLVLRLMVSRGPWLRSSWNVLAPICAGGLAAAPLLLPFAEHVLWDSLPTHAPDRGLVHFPWQGVPMSVFPFLYGPMNYSVLGPDNSGITWIPASVMCLAVFGLFGLAHNRSTFLGLIVPASLLAAKNFGVPYVNDVGRLPFLNQLTFGYSLGFVSITIAVLAGAGVAYLLRRPVRAWRLPLLVWGLYAAAMLVIGITTMNAAAPTIADVPWRLDYYHVALASGLFWIVAFPALLLLVRRRHPDRSDLLILVAVCGLALQAAACYPSGSPKAFVAFQAATAGVFALTGLGAWFLGARLPRWLALVGPSITVALTVALVTSMWPRVPDRYDPLKRAPFLFYLLDQPNAPRLHALDGVLSPNFESALGLSSLTNVDNLITKQGAMFIGQFLDRGVFPARYLGIGAWRIPSFPDPLSEFWANKRYWDLVGVRYVVTGGRDPNVSPARAQAAGAEDLDRVYWNGATVAIWRNPAAVDRAFLAPAVVSVSGPVRAMAWLRDAPDTTRTAFIEYGTCEANPAFPPNAPAGQLISLQLSANTVQIDYEANTRGVLTLTDAYARGWRVFLNGREAPLLRVDGVFRGVCLPGSGRYAVTFVYRPPGWTASLALCATGVAWVVALQGLALRRRRSSAPFPPLSPHPPGGRTA